MKYKTQKIQEITLLKYVFWQPKRLTLLKANQNPEKQTLKKTTKVQGDQFRITDEWWQTQESYTGLAVDW